MSFLATLPFKFLLPLVLLGLQFSLKLFIDRRATAYNFITSVLEVPINMIFVSLTLLAAFIIAGIGDVQKAFILFLAILSILIFCIFIWRRSIEQFDKKYFYWTFSLGILNLILALPILVYIIYFIMNSTIQ